MRDERSEVIAGVKDLDSRTSSPMVLFALPGQKQSLAEVAGH